MSVKVPISNIKKTNYFSVKESTELNKSLYTHTEVCSTQLNEFHSSL
jgi:hypothetical protein